MITDLALDDATALLGHERPLLCEHDPLPDGHDRFACQVPERRPADHDGTAYHALCRGCLVAAAAMVITHPGKWLGVETDKRGRPRNRGGLVAWVQHSWPRAWAGTPLEDRCPL